MPGARLRRGGAQFSVWAPDATALTLCLFEGEEERRVPMVRKGEEWHAEVPGVRAGQRYGYRAAGAGAPERGLCFDPVKLLLDPWASAIDRPFAYDPRLGERGVETAELVPKSVLEAPLADIRRAPPRFDRDRWR